MTRRGDGKDLWSFVLNHSDQAVQIKLPQPAIDLLTGRTLASVLELEAQGIAILQTDE